MIKPTVLSLPKMVVSLMVMKWSSVHYTAPGTVDCTVSVHYTVPGTVDCTVSVHYPVPGALNSYIVQ